MGFLLRPTVVLLALLALVVLPGSSALATQCEQAEFTESGQYPHTVYVDVTTETAGATIFITAGNYFIPADPTHTGSTPTGSTLIYGEPIKVFAGQSIRIKAVVYRAGMTDSVITYDEIDNTGN